MSEAKPLCRKTGPRKGKMKVIPASQSPDRTCHYEPGAKDRELVRLLSVMGVPQTQIARMLGIGINTLRSHFAFELETALYQKNSEVAGALFRAAMEGNVTAQMFWLKARAGWKEGAPLPMPAQTPQFDYGKLTLDEMLTMKRLLEKCAVEPLIVDMPEKLGSAAKA